MRIASLLRASLGASVSVAVLASVTSASAETSAPSDESLSEIIVTAQRRAQPLSEVPMAVAVVDARQLRDSGARDLKDIARLVPGLTVTSSSTENFTTARIRGVGTVGENPGLESSVGIVIDNVYRPRNSVGFGDLGELERVEVLKGPQGDLFGKSTSAGVINVITAAPQFTPSARAEFTAGNYGEVGGSASVTGPLVDDKLAGRLFVAARKRDGFLSVNTGAGPRTGGDMDRNTVTVRGQLLATPTSDLTLRAIVDFTHREDSCCLGVQYDLGRTVGASVSRNDLLNRVHPGATVSVADPYARRAYGNRSTLQTVDDMGVSLQGDWRSPWGGVLTSITALRKWTADAGQDADFSAADLLYRPDDGRNGYGFKQFSQELRYSGQNGRLHYLVGGFYAFEELTRRDSMLFGSDLYAYYANGVLGGAPSLAGLTKGSILNPDGGITDRYVQRDHTFALFTNNTLDLTERWDVTLGLRYTVDRKRLTEQFQTRGGACDKAQAAYSTLANALGTNGANSTVGGLCQTMMNPQFDAYRFVQRKSEGQLSGTVKTSYRFTPDAMAYASYAHGYKAGGFNMDRVQKRTVTASGPVYTPYGESAFAPEKTDSYELGTKLQLPNRSLAVNLTGFYQTFDDFQLNAYLGASFTVKSMPRVNSHGADLDVFWQTPVTSLFVQGGLTYAETRYGSFRPADAEFAPPPPGAVVGAALHRLPGSRLSFAPKYSSTFAVTYEHALAYGWTARPSTQVKYSSGYNTGSDLSPMKYQKGFALVDARLILAAPEDRYAVELWANNLFDRDYKQVGYNPTLQGGETDAPNLRTYGAFLGAPRTFGVTLRAKW